MTGLYTLAAFICINVNTAYETCKPYEIKAFASLEACELANNNLDPLLTFVGPPNTSIGIDSACLSHDRKR